MPAVSLAPAPEAPTRLQVDVAQPPAACLGRLHLLGLGFGVRVSHRGGGHVAGAVHGAVGAIAPSLALALAHIVGHAVQLHSHHLVLLLQLAVGSWLAIRLHCRRSRSLRRGAAPKQAPATTPCRRRRFVCCLWLRSPRALLAAGLSAGSGLGWRLPPAEGCILHFDACSTSRQADRQATSSRGVHSILHP